MFTTKAKGTGLGLANCQDRISRHGRTIRAFRNPDPEQGSTFVLSVPTADSELPKEDVRDDSESVFETRLTAGSAVAKSQLAVFESPKIVWTNLR